MTSNLSDSSPPVMAPALAPTGVCMLTGELPPDRGGVGDYTARLADALAALGVPVGILTRRRPGVPDRRTIGASGVPVHGTISAWDAGAWRTVCGVLGQLGPRPLLHIQFQAGAFDLGGAVHLLPPVVRAALPRARVVTTFHDFLIPYLFPKAGPVRLLANRLLARSSHAAIFTDLADLERAGPGVRGWVVPIGSNVDRDPAPPVPRADVRRLLGVADDTFLVGYFGFLGAGKGVPTLLQAIAPLAARRPTRLALIGGEAGTASPTDLAEARAIHATIEQAQRDGTVIRTGFLPSRDLSAALLACDAIALPFRDGASARRGTLMAAVAHGLPIVSTAPAGPAGSRTDRLRLGAGSRGVTLRDGEAILLVPPDDPTALTAALGRLADDPSLRRRLAAGAGQAAGRIAWPRLAAETLEVYAACFTSGAGWPSPAAGAQPAPDAGDRPSPVAGDRPSPDAVGRGQEPRPPAPRSLPRERGSPAGSAGSEGSADSGEDGDRGEGGGP